MASKKAKEGSLTAEYDYDAVTVTGKDGKTKHTRTNGDAIAIAMLKVTAGEVSIEKVIKDNNLGEKFKPAQWDNRGLLRMSVGNSLRGLVRNGTHVTIGDTIVKSLEQRVAAPKAPAKKEKAPRKPRVKKEKASEAVVV